MQLSSRIWKRYYQSEHDIFWGTVVAVFFGSLLGILMTLLILALDDEVEDMIPLGCIIGFVGLLILRIILGPLVAVPTKYNLAISMGCTRRRFVREYLRNRVAEGLASLVVLYMVYRLELLLYARIFSQDLIADAGNFFRPWIVLLVLFGAISVEIFFGALYLRFGAKSYAVYTALLLIASRFSGRLVGLGRRLGESGRIAAHNPVLWVSLGVFLLEILALWIGRKILGRQEVK